MIMRYETTVIEDEKCIARIHRPILTEDERNIRIAATKEAMVAVYKERMRNNDN